MKIKGKGVYSNGKILKDYGIVIEEGYIKEIIPNSEIGTNDNTISVDGFIYPAFIESHAHIGEIANILSHINGENFSFDEIISAIEDRDVSFIFNVNFNKLSKEQFRHLFNLDKKIYMQSKDEHSVFVSKRFLESTSINCESIDKNSLVFIDNEFIGIFKDNAIGSVKHLKEIKIDESVLVKVEEYFLSRGIVTITNFDFYIKDYLKDRKIRIVQGIQKDYLDDAILEGIKTGQGNDNFVYGPLKVFLDGSLGSQTAKMKDDYPFKGLLLLEEGAFDEIVKKANENGILVAVHAIGSEAVHIALKVFNKYKGLSKMNRIEHLQFIDQSDLPLLKETPFIPSMQPIHAKGDVDLYKKYMQGFRYAYAFNTVLKSKGFLIFGSDAPVEDASVFYGINAAVKHPLFYEESIPLDKAISAYTDWGGIYNYVPNRGSIEKGKLGDIVILKNEILEDNLLNNEILSVFKGGEIAWTK
ncbi:MAG: amidohydrolase [Caldisericum sp.]|uniref:Amidohydrolase 3 domain-containing protein n=1 Tax=Caldisericum exile TaxID=693075 RepID=A0A2J6WF96_9BACT|nr:MAG: hypothetical protein C0189_01565 [Caldisericum exile]